MNLEKNYTNNLLIDVGNSLIKFGVFDNKKWHIKRFSVKKISSISIIKTTKFFIKKFDVKKIYVCSVVKNANDKLEKSFINLKIPYYFIRQNDFMNIFSFASKVINIQEVGSDILMILYYIKDMHNLLVFNFGSAIVTIKKTSMIDGILIYVDLENALKNFLKSINLKSTLIPFKDFGNTTSQAISGSLFYLIDGYINNILNHNRECKTLVYSGGNRHIMNLVNIPSHIKTVEIDEIVLNGMYNFICDYLKNSK